MLYFCLMEEGEEKGEKRERQIATGEEGFLGPDLPC
jgi:hypothetical protein